MLIGMANRGTLGWGAVMLSLVLGCASSGGTQPRACQGSAPCPSGATCKASVDCTPDAGFQCTNGVCMRACPAGDACGTNEICADVAGKRRCLALCTDGTCSTGAGCQTHWPTRKQVCANTVFPGACTSVVDEAKCTACGAEQFTSLCSDGRVCPANSGCDPSENRCYCERGFETVACDGSPCLVNGVIVCVPPNYYCRAIELPMTRCFDEPHASSGQCKCADGRTLPFACGETASCEHRCSTGCNPTAQDCPDAWAPKCGFFESTQAVTVPTSPVIDRTSCTALNGTRKLAESCQFVALSDGGSPFDRDDCDKGLVCAGTTAPRGEARCRKLCARKVDCGAGEECIYNGLSFPPSGFCLASGCALGGTDCGAGKSCIPLATAEQKVVALVCKYDGTGTLGASCAGDAGIGCAANLRCRNGICRATCSPQRPCDAGTCEPTFEPGDPGLCG